MNGIKSRYDELLSKSNIAFVSESLLSDRPYETDSEQIFIDAQREMLSNIEKTSKNLPQEDAEKLLLNIIDYASAIEKRYFLYGMQCGCKFLTQLTK